MITSISFHTLTQKEAIQKTESNMQGLTKSQVEQRLNLYGYNELNKRKKTSLFKLFISQFKDFMIIILIIAAAVSFIVSLVEGNADFLDPIIILGIIIFNAFLGVFQESRAEHSLDSLRKLSTPYANVIRDNMMLVVPSKKIVPGDIVLLETGNYIPADARLIESIDLKIDESALTGESLPVSKYPDVILKDQTPLAERKNMVYSSSIVTYGRGKAVVTATGHDTEVGHIAKLISEDTSPETPLQKNLAKTSKILGVVALSICFIIFIIGVIQGRPLFDMFMTSVSLAVASIPL